MKEYVCQRCGYSTHQKSNLLSHLRRKTPCPNTLCDVSTQQLLNDVEGKKGGCNECPYCNKKCASRQSLSYHKNVCKLKKPTDEPKVVPNITNHITNNMTTENNTTINLSPNVNINVNITPINDFGKEDIKHITDEIVTKYIDELYDGVKDLLRHIHFHVETPQNQNIRYLTKDLVAVVQGGMWVKESVKVAVDKMIKGGQRILWTTLNHNYPDVEKSMNDERYQFLTNWLTSIGGVPPKNGADPYFQLKRSLYTIVENETCTKSKPEIYTKAVVQKLEGL